MPAIIKLTRISNGTPFWLMVSSIEGFCRHDSDEGTKVWLTSSASSILDIKESPEELQNLIQSATKAERREDKP